MYPVTPLRLRRYHLPETLFQASHGSGINPAILSALECGLRTDPRNLAKYEAYLAAQERAKKKVTSPKRAVAR